MFFAPALLCLGEGASGLRIHLLCLSTGNYDGLGAQRRQELPKACMRLGVSSERVVVRDEVDIYDDAHAHWPAARVAAIVDTELRRLGIQRVLTFDAHGVSGHANHVDVHYGVRHLELTAAADAAARSSDASGRTRGHLCAYELRSVGLARRLLGLLEALVTLLSHALLQRGRPPLVDCFVGRPWVAAWAVHCAMREHASQYVWFRRLYVLTSRYVFLNTLARMVCEPSCSD